MGDTVDVFLISGFLGSGKTSFIKNSLLSVPQSGVGVIVNEFGSVSIDGITLKNNDMKLVEINNGSIFCACLKGGFIRTLTEFLRQPVVTVFIEASGLADPESMNACVGQAEALFEKKYGNLERHYRYRGGICVVDSVNFADYRDVFPVVESQTRKSRFIVLNKADNVSEEELRALRTSIHELNPNAYLYQTNYGKVPPEELETRLIAEKTEEKSMNTPVNRAMVFTLKTSEGVTERKIRDFCAGISGYTLRIKGFAPIGNQALFADCVGDNLNFSYIPNTKENPAPSQIVVIGKENTLTEILLKDLWREYTGVVAEIMEDGIS